MKAMEIRKGLSAGNGARRSWSKPPGTGTAGRSRPATGLEKPTFVEWVVDRLPLPYAVGCGVLAVLLGPPGNVLARFLDSGSLNGSFNEYFLGEGLSATGLQLAALLLSCVHGFYLLWIIRFIRLKALAAEPALAALLPGGKDRYRRLLGAISYAGAPILLAVVFTALSWESLIPIIRDSKPPPPKGGGFCARRLKPTGADITVPL